MIFGRCFFIFTQIWVLGTLHNTGYDGRILNRCVYSWWETPCRASHSHSARPIVHPSCVNMLPPPAALSLHLFDHLLSAVRSDEDVYLRVIWIRSQIRAFRWPHSAKVVKRETCGTRSGRSRSPWDVSVQKLPTIPTLPPPPFPLRLIFFFVLFCFNPGIYRPYQRAFAF